jgi:hypothetical protein
MALSLSRLSASRSGHRMSAGPEGVVSVDKRPAEKLFVLLTALFQRSSHTKL